jgi:hypothetical protein
MNNRQQKKWRVLVWLAAALAVWASLLALGAYLQLGDDQPRYDLRKPLAILGVMGLFLGGWGIALWLRARRRR